MDKAAKSERDQPPRPDAITLREFYLISVAAMGIGLGVVFILNVATPNEFILKQFADLTRKSGAYIGLELGKRVAGLLFLIAVTGATTLLVMNKLLSPVSRALGRAQQGDQTPPMLTEKARRRLLNLPFIFVTINVAMWIVIPALVFFSAYASGLMNPSTAAGFAIRSSMVGLVSSSIAFYRLEACSRRELIPFFFPEGRLADVKGVARISISRRIRMFHRISYLVPLTILLVTLFTLQWELDPAVVSAEEYGLRIIIFCLVLGAVFLISTGVLNGLVSNSIAGPVKNMLKVVDRVRQGDYQARIRVVGNDEIGVLGDAGNEMIRGLAERETLRSAFGKYVTPEIRDEILSGRIPLEGERRVGTMMFSDLRDFTPFVENNPPEEVISGMRAYFTAMHRAIRRHRGLVLQFVGDEIEAVFGVPVRFEDHADAAVRAALDMRRALEDLNALRTSQGKPTFTHGIGIHSGRVLAGNTGSEEQSAYALIGSTVNVASRIQGLTRELGCDILLSQETVERLKSDFQMKVEAPRFVKGYSKPIVVYRVLDRPEGSHDVDH